MYDRCAYYRVKLKGVPFKVRNRYLFDNKEQYLAYLEACYAYRNYLRRAKRVRDPFYDVPPLKIFMDYRFRVQPLIEAKYYLLAAAKKISIDLVRLRMSLDDFVVHIHLIGDTFSKSGKVVLEDLRAISDTDYFRVLDSIFYKDILVTYLYKVRKRLLTYLDKGHIYTVSRNNQKLINKVEGIPDKYFTKAEKDIINSGKRVCLVRDRVEYYKRYYGK